MSTKKTGLRSTKDRREPGTALAPPTAGTSSRLAKAADGAGAVFREDGVTLVVGQSYGMGDRSIIADAVYYVGGGEVDGRNGRLGEADKIAWRDPATGYECIIMRNARGGFLSGYVAVPTSHPLYGFDHDAVPLDLELDVHGGLTYSAICDEGPSPSRGLMGEARRICHVAEGRAYNSPVEHATDYRAAHDRAWWFGFDCNHLYDVVPEERNDRGRFLGHETGAVFRDEAYVYDQVIDLAAQLRAIGDGSPKPVRIAAPPPPLGLDPRKAN